jgi:hypothetical protein
MLMDSMVRCTELRSETVHTVTLRSETMCAVLRSENVCAVQHSETVHAVGCFVYTGW